MAKARKTTTTTTTTSAPVVRSIDLIVPMGFVVCVDSDLSLRDNERPTKQRLEHAADTMFARYEDKILAALKTVFGDRVSYLETAETYTGDPKTGVAKKVHIETPIPGAAAPAPVAPAAPVEPKLEDLTVEELRERAKAAGKKTAGSKAVLIKRLS